MSKVILNILEIYRFHQFSDVFFGGTQGNLPDDFDISSIPLASHSSNGVTPALRLGGPRALRRNAPGSAGAKAEDTPI